jgi:hypothetical protein
MGNSANMPINAVKPEEVGRSAAMSMSMPYPNVPVSAPSLVPGSNYTTGYGPEVMGLQHEIPRTGFEQTPTYTTAPPMNNFAPGSYAPGSYAPIHPSQPQDVRRISHS